MNIPVFRLAALAATLVLAACSGGNENHALSATSKQAAQKTGTTLSAGDYQTDAQALYVAYFGRPADPLGLSNVEATLLAARAPTDIAGLSQAYATNASVKNLVDSFASSQESVKLYGNVSTNQFITNVFENLFNRAPALNGLTYWNTAISAGGLNQAAAALSIYAGSLANVSVQGLLDAQAIDNKMLFATLFTAQLTAQNVGEKYSGAGAAAALRNVMLTIDSQTAQATIQNEVAQSIANLLGTASGSVATLNAVTWNGAQYVAVGSGGIVETSPDGVTWTNRGSAVSMPMTATYLRSIIWQGGRYLAVGVNGGAYICTGMQVCPTLVTAPSEIILTSTDGISWVSSIAANSGFVAPSGSELANILWTGSRFVAAGDIVIGSPVDGNESGSIVTSSDGINWTAHTTLLPANASATAFNALDGVAYSGNLYVAVGANGAVYTSTDGNSWAMQATGTVNALGSVVWSGTQFIAVGQNGTIISSPDGVSWSNRGGGVQNLYAVAWSGTQFVAVGAGTILTSPDGITWTSRDAGTANSLYGITCSGSQFVAVGTGTILTSADGIIWTSRAMQ